MSLDKAKKGVIGKLEGVTVVPTSLDDKIDEMFWPHPYPQSHKPLTVTFSNGLSESDDDQIHKIFQIPYATFKTALLQAFNNHIHASKPEHAPVSYTEGEFFKIIQITHQQNRAGNEILGLGDNGKVYSWSKRYGCWYEYVPDQYNNNLKRGE